MAATENLKIRVVGIGGSLRAGSFTQQALAVALRGAAEAGAETKLIDLRDYQLSLCDGNDNEAQYPPGVFRLREEVKRAHGILLATPEYHGSFSGVLKNALDLMGFDEFEGKLVGLVGVSGGRMGAVSALNTLRNIGRTLHAWVVPEQASLPQVHQLFDGAGNLKDKDLEKRVKEVGRQVAKFAELHSCDKVKEFLTLWQEAPANPGGEAE